MSDTLLDRLNLIFEWYRGMVDPKTGQLAYLYDPDVERLVVAGSPIRDIASIWDVGLLGDWLGRDELRPLIERSLDRIWALCARHDGYSIVVPPDEAPTIAHNAVLMLALSRSRRDERIPRLLSLAEGILHQQRSDGSYRISFGDEPDVGEELYPGEAMLALLEAYRIVAEPRFLESVERAFHYYRLWYYEEGLVDPDSLVFFANWQSQAGRQLFLAEPKEDPKRFVAEYLFELHDRIDSVGFFDEVIRSPRTQSCVEVACALEGLADAYAVAMERKDRRQTSYRHDARAALAFLVAAQRTSGCTPRERGGFGQSWSDRVQRIDVTGHATSGLIKCLETGIAQALTPVHAPGASAPWQGKS